MDPLTLAGSAVALLSPYLAKAGESAAGKVGEAATEAGGKLLDWLQVKLDGRGKEALDDLKARPGAEDNQADLRKQLAKTLEANPALAAELAALLPPSAPGDTTSAVAVGDGARANAIKGDNNQVNFGSS